MTTAQTQSPTVRSTLFGAACLSLQPLLLNALSLPVMAYLIHRLGPWGYGQWMVATSLLAVCAIIPNLGLRGAFVRAVAADPASATTQLADQLGLRFLLTMLAGFVAVTLCWLLGYSSTVLWCSVIGGAGLIVTTLAATLSDLLQAMHRIKTVALVNLVAGLALTITSLLIAIFVANPIAIAASYLSGPIFSAALLVGIVSRQISPVRFHWGVRRFVQLLIRSRFFAAQQLLAVSSAQAEALILPKLVGIHPFGFFTAGSLLANRLTAIPDGLCTAAYPVMARACADGEPHRGASLVSKYIVIALIGGMLLALFGTLGAGAISRILFPSQPDLLATVIRITIWSLPLIAIESVMGYALNAAGRDAALARASVPAAITSLALSITLVAMFGVIGACCSMLLRPAIRVGFLTPVVYRTFFRAAPESVEHRLNEDVLINPEPMSFRKAG